MSNLIGLLTAVKGTAIAMTVTGVLTDSETTQIECAYTVNGELKRFIANEDAFIGFGDTLAYNSGAFVDAYFSDVTGDDEDDEDDYDESDDEPDDEEDEDTADHTALKN